MADTNEQPTLLNDAEAEVKKPRRTKASPAPKARKAPVKKTRKKKSTSEIEPVNSDHELLPRAAENARAELAFGESQDVAVEVAANHGPESTALAEVAGETQTDPAAVAEEVKGPQPVSEPPKYEPVFGEGLIEVSGKGFGFLRDPKRNYNQSPQDIFVTPEVVRKHALRDGLWIKGEIRRGSRGPQLFKLTAINGADPEKYRDLPVFEELTSINPLERVNLETAPDRYTTRVMDLMTPIGKGQRGLIVAPPRTGKTTLLQHIADAVVKNHPEMKLIILLVDERPEEVTEIRRTVPKADIMASSNDSDIKSHTRIAQLAIERAKRLVEAGEDVFVLMDSLTRVGRAFNNAMAGGGRTMSGGMDSRAMEIPRKLFAAARNTEEAGSLTIMATALIETGSKMDELIFQEFKGTGNMEMVLDRQISDQRIYPAIDIFKSGTRREELLLPVHELEKINTIRRGLAGHRPPEAIERLLSFLKKFPINSQMLREIPG
jgi:transcription termination factor Rho